MTRPILTLTTDFGLNDHFAGTMKGVILGICPRAQIVDICHHVTPFEISEGAYTIAQSCECFPKKTVHVVVDRTMQKTAMPDRFAVALRSLSAHTQS